MTPVATFQSGHGWTTGGSGITWNLNDTSDYVIGSQCVSGVTNGANPNAWVQKVGMPAIDLTTRDLAIWIKVTNLVNLKTLVIIASSDSIVNYYQGRIYDGTYGVPPGGQWREGDWIPFRFNLGTPSLSTVGSPVKSAITTIRLSPTDYGTGPCTIQLGGIFSYPRSTTYPNGVVTFGFDDSFISHRTIAAPNLARYGYAGTAYTICNQIGAGGFAMSLAQLRELRDVYGWEIAHHAYSLANHDISFADLSSSVLTTEITSMVNWMQTNGVSGSTHFAYPRGRHNATSDAVVSKYYSTGRTLQSLPLEVVQPGLPMRTRAYQFGTGAGNVTQAQDFIDRAYTNGNWLQLVFHDIVASGASGNQTLASELTTLVDYCNTKGIAVAPASDVWRANL